MNVSEHKMQVNCSDCTAFDTLIYAKKTWCHRYTQ